MKRFAPSPSIVWFASLAALASVIGVGAYLLQRPVIASAYLGAQFMPLTQAIQSRAPYLDGGAQIINIVRDGPVNKAGIKPNIVVAAIDGETVLTAREAARIIAQRRPGAKIVFTTYDVAKGDAKPQPVTVELMDKPPPTAPLTVRPFRPLAKPWFYPPKMLANAAWSQKVSGAVMPSPLVQLQRGQCTALTPAGWKIGQLDEGFLVTSAGGNVRAGYVRVNGVTPGTAIRTTLTRLFGMEPKLNLPRPWQHDFGRVDFGTLNGFGGYVLYRPSGNAVSLWIIGVPGADTASLLPLVTSVALSVRCGAPAVDATLVKAASNATSVSDKCHQGICDEGDLAGLYNAEWRMGYVHSSKGENFLINPRVSWQTGPKGPGYYRQVGGEVEKMIPGRTN